MCTDNPTARNQLGAAFPRDNCREHSWGALTSCGIQSAITLVAFEMLRFLMQGENFQVVEIALTVVAPWTGQELLQGRTTSLLAHCDYVYRANDGSAKELLK